MEIAYNVIPLPVMHKQAAAIEKKRQSCHFDMDISYHCHQLCFSEICYKRWWSIRMMATTARLRACQLPYATKRLSKWFIARNIVEQASSISMTQAYAHSSYFQSKDYWREKATILFDTQIDIGLQSPQLQMPTVLFL